ncbi:hypothetical protein AAVH_19380 [Aphelenchoides avenae]|nr:hypothetical protein AAVH_19380 [Aphelenchus avenae]
MEGARAELLLYRFTDISCRDQLTAILAKRDGRDAHALHEALTAAQSVRRGTSQDADIHRILDCSERIANSAARLSDSYEAAIQKLQKALEEKESLVVSAQEATVKLEAAARAKNDSVSVALQTDSEQHDGKDELRRRRNTEIKRLKKSIVDAESAHRSEVKKLEQKISDANVECRHYVQQMQQRYEALHRVSNDDYFLLKDLIYSNPRLITVSNVEEVLKLTARHPSDCEVVKRACEQRLRDFHNLLPIAKKCELVVQYGLDSTLIRQIIIQWPRLITEESVERILAHAVQNWTETDDIKAACEQRLHQFRDFPATRLHEVATRFQLDFQSRFGLQHYFFAAGCKRDYRATKGNVKVLRSGGLSYIQPLGCEIFTLKIFGTYRPDGGSLTGLASPLSTVTCPGEHGWAVAYHGTALENVPGIVRNGFDVTKYVRAQYGVGIYSSPYPWTALGYSTAYFHKDKQYRLILQVMVNPMHISQHDGGNVYKVPDGSSIIPYAICVFSE